MAAARASGLACAVPYSGRMQGLIGENKNFRRCAISAELDQSPR